ncbi:MAG TPA: TlpA disulfide reductase family protein [Actinomycetota bacterium]
MSTEVRERRPRVRPAAPRRRGAGRFVSFGLPALIIAALALVAVLSTRDDGGGEASVAVTFDGPALAAPLEAGDVVPGFAAPGLRGGEVSWSSYRGEPAVLVVWAPWCPHCQVELPLMHELAPEYDMTVVTVVTSIGTRPGPSPQGFMDENGLVFPTAVDDSGGTIAAGLGVQGFPTSYYVDRDGVVVETAVGEAGEDAMRASMAALAATGS